MKLSLFGHPLARPLEFVDAFLGPDIESTRSESDERGTFRIFVVEAPFEGRVVELSACIPPRREPEAAFREMLGECDAALVLAGAGGWREQEPVIDALGRARAARGGVTPFVGIINEFVPPRLDVDPHGDVIAAALAADPVLRGRVCWWRHERCGTELARAAIRAAISAATSPEPDPARP